MSVVGPSQTTNGYSLLVAVPSPAFATIAAALARQSTVSMRVNQALHQAAPQVRTVSTADRRTNMPVAGGAVLEQVAAFLDLAVDRLPALTIAPCIAQLPEQDRASLR